MKKDINFDGIATTTFDPAEVARQRASAIFTITEGFEGVSEEVSKALYELRDRVDLVRRVQRHELKLARASASKAGMYSDPGGADPRICPEHGAEFAKSQTLIAGIDLEDIILPAEEEVFWAQALGKKREDVKESTYRAMILRFLAKRGERGLTAREAYQVLMDEFRLGQNFSSGGSRREPQRSNSPLTNID